MNYQYDPRKPPPSDVVNYSSWPTAPPIIPIIFFTVVIIALILIIIKIIQHIWQKKIKSDTYRFVEPVEEQKLHYTVDDKPDGKLIPLTYVTVRRHSSNGNIGAVNANCDAVDGSPHVRVEANVHPNNHLLEDNPLNNRTATESDV
jgi:hypothetical protein